jgi:hypothetical protein
LTWCPSINCVTMTGQLTPASDEPRWYTVSQILQFRHIADCWGTLRDGVFLSGSCPPLLPADAEMPRRSAPHRCRTCYAAGWARFSGIQNDDSTGAGSGYLSEFNTKNLPVSLQISSVIILPFHSSYQIAYHSPRTIQLPSQVTVQTCNQSGLRAKQTVKPNFE